MRFLYTLPLALWLAFSSTSHAITFNFKVIGGDTDRVDFEASLELDPVGQFSASASIIDRGGSIDIASSGGFRRFDLRYNSFGNMTELFLTPTDFRVLNPNLDRAGISQGPQGASLFHVNPNVDVSSFNTGGLLGLWTLRFGTDNLSLPDPVRTLTGTFVQAVEVPEAPAIPLLMIGLALIGLRASQRSA